MIFHDVDLERDARLDKRGRQRLRLRGGEGVEIVFQLLLGFRGGVLRGRNEGAPVGAVEDACGAHVQDDDGVAGAEVVLDRPLDGEGALVAEIDGDGDAALRFRGGKEESWGPNVALGGVLHGCSGIAR